MELNLKMLQAEQAEEERERLQLRRAESRELTLQRNPSKPKKRKILSFSMRVSKQMLLKFVR